MKFVVKLLRAALLLLLAGLLLPAAGWAQSQDSQSLGDVARKQREKKTQEPDKGKKVLSNDDLPTTGGISSGASGSGSSGSSSASESAAADSGADAAKEGKGAAQGPVDPAAAAEELDVAKKELENLKHDETSLENGISKLEQQAADTDDDSRREIYRNAAAHARTNLADTQKKREEAEKKLAEKEAAAKAAQPSQPQEQPPQ